MTRLGIVAFSNDSGLGNQTRRLVYMLTPFRVLVIDSRGFSRNKQFRQEWFNGFSGYKIQGFPKNNEIRVFLKGLTHVLVCENPLNFYLFSESKRQRIKTYCQSNYEFCDNLNRPDLPLPDKFLMPSYWHVETMKDLFGEDRVMHLPPPNDASEFILARDTNFEGVGRVRFFHIV